MPFYMILRNEIYHNIILFLNNMHIKSIGKVFYRPVASQWIIYTTTECGVNYQLLTVIFCSSPMENY